ncbi:helix-turn-helix domain-containing protein [Aquimarina aquimarini]|uniref:helix-turn-helix domain-containing protein n=1 Tax=Aquimarina aquimarini TaxID=1191734 RepID=UPI000D55D2B0|nr:helix-turn-helix domain-containing protein [Aquimarina aquimarini]
MYSAFDVLSIENKGMLSYCFSFSNDNSNGGANKRKDQMVLGNKEKDSTCIFKEFAFQYAKRNQPEKACVFIEKYIGSSLDVTFVANSNFDSIKESESYKGLVDKYLKQFDWRAVLCFCVAFIGFFVAVVLNLRRRSDTIANILMGAFVLLNSCFMTHMGLYFMNYEYYLPHTLYLFSTFAFLYGPLIFFYFKRVTQKYKFKYIDILHLLPTIFLIALLFPVYLLPGEEKLRMVIHYERPYLTLISVSKLISLLIYGVLVVKTYIQPPRNDLYISEATHKWQRNIVVFCSVYILSYAIYGVLNMSHIGSGVLFNIQVISIALMVLYVSYSAFVQPSLFGRLRIVKSQDIVSEEEEEKDVSRNGKYEKSGLTTGLSLELKKHLIQLLIEEKVFKQNDITLQKLSELLGTTRHNTSQIINEHFGLNFFELINKYRIDEAKKLLQEKKYKNFNIIDIAYEVGYNNKVTFNKSFKKYNQITPSEYQKRYVA